MAAYPLQINSTPGRFLMAVWFLIVIVMTRSYSSSLTSVLAVRSVEPKYETMRDLVNDPSIQILVEDGTALVELLEVSGWLT